MIKKRHSLSRQLSRSLILSAFPIFLLSMGIFFLQSHYLIHQEARHYTNSILRTATQRVINYMGTIETASRSNVWLLEQRFSPDSLEAISHRIVALNPHVISCSVSTEPDVFPAFGRSFSVYTTRTQVPTGNGKALRDTVVTVRETDFDYFDKSWYRTAQQSGEACWVDPFIDFNEGTIDHREAVASYCIPLRREDGRIVGVVSTDFSFSQLARAVNAADHPYPHAYFMLLGGDGRYLVHPDAARLFRKTIFSETDPRQNADVIALGHEMLDGREGLMHVTLDSDYCHVCYAPVPGTGWSVALVCPDDEILIDYYHLVYVIVVLIAVGLLAIMWLSRHVVRRTIIPINELVALTQKIIDGDYDAVIPTTSKKDTIGQMQNSFAAMQQSLHVHMQGIENATEQLTRRNRQQQLDIQMAEEAFRQKDMFIKNVSHQIRTPLNIIVGFTNVLHERRKRAGTGKTAYLALEEANIEDISQNMRHNAVLLKRMILMLFDSSERGTIEEKLCARREELACNDVARDSISYTESHFPRLKIALNSELSDSIYILSNSIYLARTLRELLYNAAVHSDRKHIIVQVSQTADTVRFTVQDTGPGLPAESMQLIDCPFTKFNQFSEGLGLGLPLCKRHAVNLGGQLILDTSYRQGCRITVELPK